MKIKVCGMRDGIEDIGALQPDYLGFIFWEPSSRYFAGGELASIPSGIERVGVFVDAGHDTIREKVKRYGLHVLQLHGKESPEYCTVLREEFPGMKLIKAFPVGETFDFGSLSAYESSCDFFLFDTKGKLPGGNSRQFNWRLLDGYPGPKPYFISGGIGPGDLYALAEFLSRPEASYCHAVDINSKFERSPGNKNRQEVEDFIKAMRQMNKE